VERPKRGAIVRYEAVQGIRGESQEDFEGTLLYSVESGGTVPMKPMINRWRDSRQSGKLPNTSIIQSTKVRV
jgi:hypothetical protein